MSEGVVRELHGRGPLPGHDRVRQAVLDCVAASGGCPSVELAARVRNRVGQPRSSDLDGRIQAALGVLFAEGAVDELNGTLVLCAQARAAM